MVGHRDCADLCRLLSAAVAQGMALDAALAFVASQVRGAELREALAAAEARVRDGAPLGEALRARPGAVPADVLAAADAGARSGALVPMLRALESYYRVRDRIARGARRLAAVAVAALLAACGVSALAGVLAGIFAEIYESVDARLPPLSRAALGIRQHPWLMAVAVLAAGAVGLLALRAAGRWVSRRGVAYGVPFWGPVLRQRDMALICATLASRLGAGAAMDHALAAARDVLTNRRARRAVDAAIKRVREGEPLSAVMFYDRFWPRTLAWAASVGEQRASLAETMETFAGVYRDALDRAAQAALLVLTPASVFVTAHVVVFGALVVLEPMVTMIRGMGSFARFVEAGWSWEQLAGLAITVASVDIVCLAVFGFVYSVVTQRRLKLRFFVDALAAVARRNLPLQTGLRMLGRDAGGFFGLGVERAARLAEEHGSIAAAVVTAPRLFPAAIRNALRMGERSGNLAPFLDELSRDYARVVRFTDEWSLALAYPLVLSTFVALETLALMTFIAPRLNDVWESVRDTQAAASTGWSFFWGGSFGEWLVAGAEQGNVTRPVFWAQAVLLLAVATVLAVGFGGIPGYTSRGRRGLVRWLLDHLVLRVPGVRRVALHRTMRAVGTGMGLYLRAGATVPQALREAADLDIHTPIAARLRRAAGRVEEGASMSDALRREGLVPEEFLWFVEAGEAAGTLPQRLLDAAAHHETRTRYAEHFLERALVPAFVVANGAVVLLMCLTCFAPMVYTMNWLGAK